MKKCDLHGEKCGGATHKVVDLYGHNDGAYCYAGATKTAERYALHSGTPRDVVPLTDED